MNRLFRTQAQGKRGGYTLVELIVSLGLFTLVMTLVSGAYLMMIGANRQAQGIATGIDNLAFALETMTRSIRTGGGYVCNGVGDCADGSTFSFTNTAGQSVSYFFSNNPDAGHCAGASGCIMETVNGVPSTLTDPSVNITSLRFYASGTRRPSAGDYNQAYVTVIVSGSVPTGPGKPPAAFTVESSATMRGADL